MDVETAVRSAVDAGAFIRPTFDQKIFKDQCAYCFKDPHGKDGLYISLKNYHAFCREHAEIYGTTSGNTLFVQFESTKKIIEERTDGEPTSKMTKLTIDSDPKFEFEDKYCVVVHPEYSQQVKNVQNLPEIAEAIAQIANTTSAERLSLLSSTSNAWDAEIKLITKHQNLEQQDNGKHLALTGWTCEVEGCGLNDNLWLNLTDGAVRCGRSQFLSDGKKTNGNGHMQDYFDSTRFPLVVKLGTISSNLELIDVYSYDEDDAVIDPNLEKHLKHFGLDPTKMEKTAKSTMEMELDMNEKWEWSKCTEDGLLLEPIFGPGYTGLVNTGSSCYMNSVLQALVTVDSFQTRYGEQGLETLVNCPLDKLHNDFNAQFSKVVRAMLSGDYSSEMDPTNNHIKPLQFKRVAAGNHRDFSTSKQQDVEEYIRFLFEKIAENSRTEVIDPTDSFKFKAINRFEDRGTRRVRYTDQEEMLIRLPISGDLLRPIPDTENRYSVDMKAAIHAYFDVQKIDDYISPITGEPKGATNTISMKTFPDYLFFQVSKFAYNVDGTQKKLDMELEIEEELDLSGYRGHGKLEHEIALPDEEPTAPRTTPDIPASVRFVAGELMLMGFCENACYRAAYYSNGNVEIASNWLMEHMDDSDINDLFVIPSGTPSARGEVDPNLVASIVEMGFSNHQAKYALKQVPTVAEAVEWLFANMDSIPVESAAVGLSSDAPEPSVTESATQKTFKDGGEKYKLIGMISHMGSRPDSGHYVAHMLKEGKWVLFNDEKVALSQDPPKKLAYVYLYKRIA
ncbi:Ubiquitin carboxyl-terminal hydrolase [Caenorhabditis elegans]|uniref:Ubiquitin carboxyl-terminal hydrolase n=1 Tax=Caenorhabditis elegans TaxID=6239 RepID=P91502_CAEEL|nr:Ubiquitin carboxyl-terminal hydrolase [Caenorhabditis elegans]CCD72002.1 Ubiquitin carboxyl-terminal hydrolase [Caenorhabditis elegans]|eukprot:NP_491765.2 Ubiquitin carboxyl-terminal hydrolase [Caenorhabditis elegans]